LNTTDGTLQEQQFISALRSIFSDTYGDINGDGMLDVVGLGEDGGVWVYFGNGDGSFQAQQHLALGNSLYSLTLGDVNGDGAVDVIGLDNGDVSVVLGNGDGMLDMVISYWEFRPISVRLNKSENM
jgi:hypothetical protein